MIETIALYTGATTLGLCLAVYLAGTLIVLSAFLNESRPLNHVIYLPLLLLWPIEAVKRLREQKEAKS